MRINAKRKVVDFNGEVIPGIYCSGEPAHYLAFST